MPEDVQNNNVFGNPNVVIALLDWGLGHTTRSIPIIRLLTETGCKVTVACNSSQKALLVREFPSIIYLHLDGYNLSYGKSSLLTKVAIALQAPKILTNVNREHKWLHGYVKTNTVDFIISDNRYGFRHKQIPSVIITHQLSIRTGTGWFIDKMVNHFIRKWIERFLACWVPDSKNEPSLAGELSHPAHAVQLKTLYLGPLSRFEPCTELRKERFILIVLSGPEPQRSILEEILVRQASGLLQEFIFVRGTTENPNGFSITATNIKFYDTLSSTELNPLLCSAELVISRAGYTSIMDFAKLGTRSVLIPTPGQAEQEYLASYLSKQQFAMSCDQEEINLEQIIEKAKQFEFRKINTDMNRYKQEILRFLEETLVQK